MNESQNRPPFSTGTSENCCFCKITSRQISGLKQEFRLDVLALSTVYHEKLAIIYANIRV
jgi:hypothetical protein